MFVPKQGRNTKALAKLPKLWQNTKALALTQCFGFCRIFQILAEASAKELVCSSGWSTVRFITAAKLSPIPTCGSLPRSESSADYLQWEATRSYGQKFPRVAFMCRSRFAAQPRVLPWNKLGASMSNIKETWLRLVNQHFITTWDLTIHLKQAHDINYNQFNHDLVSKSVYTR